MLRQDFTIHQLETRDGLKVEIGASLLLLALVMVQIVHGIGPFLHSLAVFVLILLSLHLREMARGWVVRAFGLKLSGIVLSGAGGHTLHERGTDEQEELIAAIGPITSFALWAGTNLMMPIAPEAALIWLQIFAFVNLFIGIFTALPVQPMDGGRFLHLYLTRHFGQRLANRIMGFLGLGLSVFWLPASLLAFLICGMVLIALPSPREHWDMLKGADPVLDGS